MIDVFAKTFMTATGVAAQKSAEERRAPEFPAKIAPTQTASDGLVSATLASLGFRRKAR